ncbi:MAG: hypothetical protein WBC48_00420 [Minisyncoccales bacterium]
MKIVAIILLILIFGVSVANADICEMTILGKFFIFPEEQQILTIQSETGPCKLVNNPPDIEVVRQAKGLVDRNNTATKDHNLTIYAQTLQMAINTIDTQSDPNIWLLSYPAQTAIVPQNTKITAGNAIAIIMKDNIAVGNKLVDVYKVDNINPPWAGMEKGIECNGAVNATNTDEVIQTFFIGKVDSITPVT